MIGILMGILLGIGLEVFKAEPGSLLVPHLMLLLLFTYIDILIHEAGHAAFGRLAGIRIRLVQIGTGRTLFTFRVLGIPLSITSNLRGGFTYPENHGEALSKPRFFVLSAGGVLGQGIAVAISTLVIGFHPARMLTAHQLSLSSPFLVSNMVLILINLLPFRIRPFGFPIPNDGMRLLTIPFMKEPEMRRLLSSMRESEVIARRDERDYQGAEKLSRAIVSEYPEQPSGYVSLSAVLMRQLKIDEAIALLEELNSRGFDKENEPVFRNNLAWAYLLKGDKGSLEKASLLSELAFSKYPSVNAIRNTRGCILIARGETEKGIATLEGHLSAKSRIDEKVNPPPGFIFMALANLRLGRTEKARKILERIARYKGHWDDDDRLLFETIRSQSDDFGGIWPELAGLQRNSTA